MPSLNVEQQAAAPSVFGAGALEICRRGASILGDPRVEISKIRLVEGLGVLVLGRSAAGLQSIRAACRARAGTATSPRRIFPGGLDHRGKKHAPKVENATSRRRLHTTRDDLAGRAHARTPTHQRTGSDLCRRGRQTGREGGADISANKEGAINLRRQQPAHSGKRTRWQGRGR